MPKFAMSDCAICYCICCGEDITFDLARIRAYNWRVFAFEPIPRAIAHVTTHPRNVPNFRLEEVAIWNQEDTVRFYARPGEVVSHSITVIEGTSEFIEVPTKRLSQVMGANGHAALTLLKMDIEGAEHTVIRAVIVDRIRIAAVQDTIRILLTNGFDYYWLEVSNFPFVRRQLLRRLG